MNRAGHSNARRLIEQTWQSQANLSLFLALLALTVFVLPNLHVSPDRFRVWADTIITLVLVSGVAIGWGRKWLFLFGLAFAIPAVITQWATYFSSSRQLLLWSEGLSLVAVVVLAYVLLAQVFRDDAINMMRVQGAVAAYLLIGVAYAYAYLLDWHVNPGAITSTEGPMARLSDWLYFSFCTLSTVGYGDIVPTSRLSRSLATAEAITGQLYLAITIARLVGMEIGSRQKERVIGRGGV